MTGDQFQLKFVLLGMVKTNNNYQVSNRATLSSQYRNYRDLIDAGIRRTIALNPCHDQPSPENHTGNDDGSNTRVKHEVHGVTGVNQIPIITFSSKLKIQNIQSSQT